MKYMLDFQKGINVLSLFDGISCGQVALEKTGIKVNKYYASEIDKYAIQVTQKNYPNTIQLGDVEVWWLWDIDWASIDLLIGGSPCQGFSFAGKQLNFDDPRSKLFFVYADILNHIRKYNPDVKFLLENVKMKKEYQDIISSYLGVEPVEIDSALVSAQNRKRLYWTNIPVEKPIEKSPSVLKDIMVENVEEKYFYNYPLLDINMSKNVCATMDFKNQVMHKRIYNPKFKCATLTCCRGGNTQRKVLDNGRARKLTPLEYERLRTLPDNYTSCLSDSQRYNCLGNGWTVNVIAHIFSYLVLGDL